MGLVTFTWLTWDNLTGSASRKAHNENMENLNSIQRRTKITNLFLIDFK